ncbi:MAG TPA: ABC transporter permease, partial [Kofleriaceae bacterium]|nr:ABC transporter permease [Kofleriaceae bacterium]
MTTTDPKPEGKAPEPELTPAVSAPAPSLWRDAWRRLRKNKMAVGCGIIFFIICVFCGLGPILAGWLGGIDGTAQNVALGASGPSWAHWMGTDTLGRDMMVRTMEGGRLSIIVGIIATAVALVIGVAWGAIAAYVGGWIDDLMMRFVDAMYAFPTVVFVIVVMAVLQTKSLVALFALIGGIRWLGMSRIVRGQVLSLRNQDFVEAARAVGVPT